MEEGRHEGERKRKYASGDEGRHKNTNIYINKNYYIDSFYNYILFLKLKIYKHYNVFFS